MNAHADAAQIRRWQDAVARDPGSPAFLPLAEVYRREGRTEVARRLCLRGLERHPENVEGHFLLGRLYREAGELDQAFDEWDIALRLDPEHRGARRALGYLCLERRDWSAAARHLAVAAHSTPGDERLAGALALARRRAGAPPVAELDPSEALAAPLERFVRNARVRLAFVMDGAGRVLARQGFAQGIDIAAFATLGAGIHSASRNLAQVLGQPAFDQLYHGRDEHQLFLAPVATVAGELVLVAVFGTDTTVGLVRVVFGTFSEEAGGLELRAGGEPTRVDAASFEASLHAGLRADPAAARAPLARS